MSTNVNDEIKRELNKIKNKRRSAKKNKKHILLESDITEIRIALSNIIVTENRRRK